MNPAILETARSWVSLMGGKPGVAKVMKFRSYWPCAIQGPEVGVHCRIHAIGADRGGIALLDTGGTVHWVEWEALQNGGTQA